MIPSQLKNTFQVLWKKKKEGLKVNNFEFKANRYMYEILKTLRRVGLLTELVRKKKNNLCMDFEDVLQVKVYPIAFSFKIKNYPKVFRIYLENDTFATLLVSTSEYGILTLQEAKQKKVGGRIVAKIVAKKPIITL
jgi:ribosomal protein S8